MNVVRLCFQSKGSAEPGGFPRPQQLAFLFAKLFLWAMPKKKRVLAHGQLLAKGSDRPDTRFHPHQAADSTDRARSRNVSSRYLELKGPLLWSPRFRVIWEMRIGPDQSGAGTLSQVQRMVGISALLPFPPGCGFLPVSHLGPVNVARDVHTSLVSSGKLKAHRVKLLSFQPATPQRQNNFALRV